MKRNSVIIVAMMILLLSLIAGCSHSPYVGSWTNHSGFGESTITLNSDGTGSASGFIYGSGYTFSWHENNGKKGQIDIDNRKGGPAKGFVGWFDHCQLSPDEKTITVEGDSYQKDTK